MGLLDIPWRPLHAISWDAFVSVLQRLGPGRKALPAAGVPVFVMLPLDAGQPGAEKGGDWLRDCLKQLAGAGVRGVMVDVWWGRCEPQPGEYDFGPYVKLAAECRSLGLKLQAVMSFHACGGNVGDSVNIPLPAWVESAGDEHGLWFTDREGNASREYITFGADRELVLPSGDPDAPNRSPIDAYRAFVHAFVTTMRAEGLLGHTVSELQLGLGPCGELRYPSYPLSRWDFPGIGEFQCFDRLLIDDLSAAARASPDDAVVGAELPPAGTGAYNDKPSAAPFFRRAMFSPSGRFFLDWYSGRMLQHADDVLSAFRDVLPADDTSNGGLDLALKISGVHWWKFSRSRAAEATTGYIAGGAKPIYDKIVDLAARYHAVVDFTCLEMRSIDQPLWARCGPRQLVHEVFHCAWRKGVPVAGENALQDFSRKAFRQIASAFKHSPARKSGFTLLRLCDDLMRPENLSEFKQFVDVMATIPAAGRSR